MIGRASRDLDTDLSPWFSFKLFSVVSTAEQEERRLCERLVSLLLKSTLVNYWIFERGKNY